MPLSEPAPRQHFHTRHVECHGYLRDDGLWDIEGRMVDTKTYSFPNRHRGEVAAGQPVHEMWLRLTIDDSMRIHEVEAVTDYGPFGMCPAITGNFKRLEGLTIGPGFRRAVRARVGGTAGVHPSRRTRRSDRNHRVPDDDRTPSPQGCAGPPGPRLGTPAFPRHLSRTCERQPGNQATLAGVLHR